ncbi:MAG: type II toxin-antitoxin system VapC family toxin [Proteobacteria bacterium]|nr:type II toxin-antitoxin system VapC family toxin [Pseudomonadota bacterium]
MISVDTNVLVRILIDDPTQPEQVSAARAFAKKAKKLFVTQLVQIETVWVLESAYHIAKEDILKILQHLYENDAFVSQHESQLIAALQLYRENNCDFSDCLIFVESKQEDCSVVTFDKKFARISGVKLLD